MRCKAAILVLAALVFAMGLPAAPKSVAAQAILKLLNSRAAGNPREFAEAAEIVAKEAASGKALHQFVLALVSRDRDAPPAARLDEETRKKYLNASRDKIAASAEKGNSMSMYLLSMANNDVVLLKRAAEAGNVQAMNAWGTISMSQAFANPSLAKEDVDRVLERSYAYFKDAADMGDANGLYNLGMCYVKGYAVEENIDRAFTHFKAAAQLGHSEAINNIGGFYRDGLVVEKDPVIATKWFKRSSNMENPYGMLNYGLALQRGEGIEKDEKKAVELFKRSAAAGCYEAMNAYGMCYYSGIGVKKDVCEAVKWFRASANGGFAPAMENIAECYEIGAGGLKRDLNIGTVWRIRARAANGDRNAAAWLAQNGYTLR